ncbi:MAG: hypothetical protein HY809_09555 [Nitrospirae bacterium]|nr:hypothetical protein [Nitrospirota bacterium]
MRNAEIAARHIAEHLSSIIISGGSSPQKYDNISGYVEKIRNDFGIENVKFFSERGEVIYSSFPEEIGTINRERYFSDYVSNGNAYTVEVEKDTKTLEGRVVSADLIEAYIPVMAGGSFKGAIEVYYDITGIKKDINQLVWSFSILSFFLSLLFLVPVSMVFIYGLNRDIAEEKRSRKTLKRANDSLDAMAKELEAKVAHLSKMDRTKSDLIANISHEIKTPLTSIIGFAETLQSGAMNDSQAAGRFLSIIMKNAEGLLKLTEELLNLSELELGIKEIKKSRFNLHELAAEVISGFSPIAAEKPCAILLRHSDRSMHLNANRENVKVVFHNLIDNTIKYGKPGGTTTVSLIEKEKEVIIDIADDGTGIHREHLSNVFERFYRADKSRSRQTEGYGLGLSIVKQIVMLHGGHISMSSDHGKGTNVMVSFPKD